MIFHELCIDIERLGLLDQVITPNHIARAQLQLPAKDPLVRKRSAWMGRILHTILVAGTTLINRHYMFKCLAYTVYLREIPIIMPSGRQCQLKLYYVSKHNLTFDPLQLIFDDIFLDFTSDDVGWANLENIIPTLVVTDKSHLPLDSVRAVYQHPG